MEDAQGSVDPPGAIPRDPLYQPWLGKQGSWGWGEGNWATGSFSYLRTSIIRPDGGPAHLPCLPARKGVREEQWEARDPCLQGPHGHQGAPRPHAGPALSCPHPWS